jgi:hypothetical protein
MDRRAELRELVARYARDHGATLSPLPGLRFNRADRASVFASGRVPSLALALVV